MNTKSLYDNCNLKKKDQESEQPFQWITAPLGYNTPCYQSASPFLPKPTYSVPYQSVNTESMLRNQYTQNSRCPETRYNPTLNCKNCTNCNAGIPCDCTHCKTISAVAECDFNLAPDYTRLKKSCNLAGVQQDRISYLGQDVNVFSNDFVGMNTRQSVKDQYKLHSQS